MIFNSIQFLIFFPITVAVYFIIPAKVRYLWLLAASYYFYMQWNPVYSLLLLMSTVVTYAAALLIEKFDKPVHRKICLTTAILINLATLGYFKYSDLLVRCVNKGLGIIGLNQIEWNDSIVLPVGISFFTLQALGYLIDVYRKDIYAEHNFFRYALFVSYFPQLVAGPIERSKNLLKQLAVPAKFTYENLRRGLMIMLYGFFLKVVIADRLAIVVDVVYGNPEECPGFYIIVATVLFAIQIYCDFYGYSTIAKGAALTMGIKLMDNFNAPLFSKSIKEFWRRWHISLSSWFRDYLYIPLGGNRKGKIRQYINLMIVFMVSGLWHGAAVSFVIWGALHGVYQIAGALYSRISAKIKGMKGQEDTIVFSDKLIKTVFTFALICFAWIFFRANSYSAAKRIIAQMFAADNWTILFDQSLYKLGVQREYFTLLFACVGVLAVVDYLKYTGKDVVAIFFRQRWWFRVFAEILLLVIIILFGCYGSAYDVQQFIYFQF